MRSIFIICGFLFLGIFLTNCSQKEELVKYPFTDGDFFEYKTERADGRRIGPETIVRYTVSVMENENFKVKRELITKTATGEMISPGETKTYDKYGRLISVYDDLNKRKLPVKKIKGRFSKLYLPDNKRKNGEVVRMEGVISDMKVIGEREWNGRKVWVLKTEDCSYIYDKNTGILIYEDSPLQKRTLVRSSFF